jgi:tetratricopeptide (TPR) repeat protein
MAPENPPPSAGFLSATAIDAELECGVALHHEGKLADAACRYREVLRRRPGHSKAMHLLGVVACQMGLSAQGVELIAKAITLDPDDAAAHNDLGVAVNGAMRFAEALESFDRAVALRPDYADAFANRGAALRGCGKLDQALDSYDRAIALDPGHAAA